MLQEFTKGIILTVRGRVTYLLSKFQVDTILGNGVDVLQVINEFLYLYVYLHKIITTEHQRVPSYMIEQGDINYSDP